MTDQRGAAHVDMGTTPRNLPVGTFADFNGNRCSVQMSSLANLEAIWLGVDDASPKVLHSDAKNLGVDTDKTFGWVEYPIPPEVSLTTRMHLSREQVAALLPILHRFVDTGSF